MTKVAFFYATFPRPTETFVRRELRALDDIGFKPDIYSIWGGNSEWENRKINRFRFPRLLTLFFWLPYWAWKKPKVFKTILCELWIRPCPNLQNWNETFLGLAFALVEAKKFEGKNYELVHGVWATMPATAVFALNRLIDIPYSMGAHAYDVFRKGGDWLLNLKFKHAQFVRTSSFSTVKRIESFGVSSAKIKLIRRGISNWPKRDGFHLVNSEKLEILSVGRLVEKKGYFCQLKIARELKDIGIPFRLRIVGDGPLLGELLIERNRLELIGNVEFLGSKNQSSISKLYLSSDIFLFTGIVSKNGDRDGIPNVILEAMASGCLIMASGYAGASEAFIDKLSGFSLNPYNAIEWIEILRRFWTDSKSFNSLRYKAIEHSKKAFNIKRTASALFSTISER